MCDAWRTLLIHLFCEVDFTVRINLPHAEEFYRISVLNPCSALIKSYDILEESFSICLADVMRRHARILTFHANWGESKVEEKDPYASFFLEGTASAAQINCSAGKGLRCTPRLLSLKTVSELGDSLH